MENEIDIFTYQQKLQKNNQFIYTISLVSLFALIASLPLIKVPISARSTGILQPNIDRTELVIPSDGRITYISLKDNKKVLKNEVLLKLDASLPEKETQIVVDRLAYLNKLQSDLRILLSQVNDNLTQFPQIPLKTTKYITSYQQFRQEMTIANQARDQADRTFKRYEILFKNGVLTSSEFEKYKFDSEQSAASCTLLREKYRVLWEEGSEQYKNEVVQLSRQGLNLEEEKKSFTYSSPVSGTVQTISSLNVGSKVFANQKIGEISPDTALTALVYVSPSAIGMMYPGQSVSFQMDSFNYNDWGLVKGVVKEIADDIVMVNQKPYFKIKCGLNQNFLMEANGRKGYLKKGMSFTARFKLTERSLFQLLYDKMDDWMNPNMSSKAE
ncbi:HlyD family secretion protein [Mucilaginibacter rubeus]|uniref:HlyD family secretion protein n=1 Tax=Mucilaginibacter rubeus TaxID=2027860 RepID=UPI003391840C